MKKLTKVELDKFLSNHYMFDIASALYWYCADHHGGQNSPLYAIMSKLKYTPAITENNPGDMGMDIYTKLQEGIIDPEELMEWLKTEVANEKFK